jgi:hypothetical protein
MTERRPFSRLEGELRTGLDTGTERTDPPIPEDGLRQAATDPPAVVPTMSSEQPVVAAGMGLSSFAQADPEWGLTGADDAPEAQGEAEADGTASEGER